MAGRRKGAQELSAAARRDRLVELFGDHHRLYGRAPTVRWLGACVGVTTGIVQRDLQLLERDGRLVAVGEATEARRYSLPGLMVLRPGDRVRVRLRFGAEVDAELIGLGEVVEAAA